MAELDLFVLGIVLYVRATAARDAVGRYAFWTFVASLVVIYAASSFGPPPPNVTTLAASALAGWLFVLWATARPRN